MGRGTQRYSPASESSPGYRTADPTKLVRALPPDGDRLTCHCGCGETPKGKNALFAMGHDARLRGKLIRAALAGAEVRTVYPAQPDSDSVDSAETVLDQYGWGKYLTEAELRREGKNRQVLQKAMGHDRLVRVGRWEFTGGQVAAIYRTANELELEIEYVTRMGDVRRKRVPAGQSLEDVKQQEESP